MKSRFARLRNKTIFAPIEYPPKHPNQVLAAYYSRCAFTIYLIFFGWSMLSIHRLYTQLMDSTPNTFATYLPIIIIPIAAAAVYGALCFPQTARWELFSVSALVSLVIALLITAFVGELLHPSDEEHQLLLVLLHTTYLVVPISRVVFIFNALIKEAK